MSLRYKPRVTVVDVLEVGACIDGVKEWVERHSGVIAGNASDHPQDEWVQKAANVYGYGDG